MAGYERIPPDANARRSADAPPMKVAIIHFWLVNMRGGEKVLEALCDLFPEADIFTHVYDPKKVSPKIRERKVYTTFIQKLPFARKHYQKYLPFMPMALEQLDLSEYDLVISCESGPAKGVIVRPDALHICYVFTPMRYLWDQYTQYRKSAGGLTRLLMPWLTSNLRQWDVTSAARVDHFISISNAVTRRIRKYWRRDAELIAPPVDVDRFDWTGQRDDFYLHVGELVPYKRVDLAVKACTMLGRKLIVIGDGPEMKKLKKMAGPTVEFVGRVPDEILTEHYQRCRALLFPAEEDFGIVPVEAMAAGAPVIAYARGGAEDTIIDGRTGVTFKEHNVGGMITGIVRFEMDEDSFEPSRIAKHARNFDRELFKERFMAAVRGQLGRRAKDLPGPLDRKPSEVVTLDLALGASALKE
jgi:glycosyltransferase involved in cell wall biosynthesis